MITAKLGYLTTPDPGRYILHFQSFGSNELMSIEVSPEQMRNILHDGVTHMLRHSFHRVPTNMQTEDAHDERADDRRQQPA